MSDNDDRAPRDRPWHSADRQELTVAVRRLMTTVVASSASPEAIKDATARVAKLADELETSIPVPGSVPQSRYDRSVVNQGGEPTVMTEAMPFDMIVGSCNPVAPPMTIEFDPPKAIGTVLYTPQYEGAPGCVHGAALAGAFDIILTAANFLAQAAGPTVELTIRYRKPTLISQPAIFEAWVIGQEGRRVHSRGRLIQGEVVTVEAEGTFVDIGRSRIEQLHRRTGGGRPATSDQSES